MTRQDTVIKIAKITKIIGEWKFRYDLDGEVEMETLSPELLDIATWIRDIQQYIESDSSPVLVRLIMNIGFTDMLDDYIHEHKIEIDSTYFTVLEDYIANMKSLLALCNRYRDKRKGEYTNLIEPLANKQVAELLQRSVDAGILDSDYQPFPETQLIELRAIAYAISYICKFKHPYNHFEKLWKRTGNNRISTCKIPKCRRQKYDYVKSIYPEVDFSEMESTKKIEVFYIEQNEEDRLVMFDNLLKYGYISLDTTFEKFNGIFDKERFSGPIYWKKGQRQLAYFLFQAFGRFNEKNLWIKGEYCFHVNGQTPHIASLSSGCSFIKRSNWTDRFDLKLKEICDRFNHIKPVSVPFKESRPVHTSKCVFHSTASPEAITAMYDSLVNEGYIDPQTSLEAYKGIFMETEFKSPVVWMKSQIRLSYLVHLAFKPENPFDMWVKSVYCFRFPSGKAPSRESMDSNFRALKKRGTLDTFDIKLKTIADNYLSSIQKI